VIVNLQRMSPVSRSQRARLFVALAGISLSLSTMLAGAANRGGSNLTYKVLGSVRGPDGPWDYANVDAEKRLLYIAREGVAVLNLESQIWVNAIAPAAVVNGVVPVPSRKRLLFTDRRASAVVVYDTELKKPANSIPIGAGADALAFDAKTNLIAVVTGRAKGAVTLIDLEQLKTVATVAVGGKLEFIATDERGDLYVNVDTANQIAVIDLATKKILRRIPLKRCTSPTGLAYDQRSGLLVAACENTAKIIRASDGADIATLEIGEGADAVLSDPDRQQVFIPCGESGTLVIVDLADSTHVHIKQTLETQVGARTGAVDALTGKVYLPTGKPGPIVAPNPWPSTIKGTFEVLVVGPL
jgi:DNA-binding beta-propeller fold protein YncE